ncbi:MAG: PhoH family protein, partial [Candidatus Omnitrophica bacterium]|nr:PhoH family protein [Candidatus Omnitrophota bacterium]
IIPIYAMEEIDKLKSEQSSRGKSAREVCRILDELRSLGSLSSGVPVSMDGGTLRILVPSERKALHVALDHNNMDNVILQCALDVASTSEFQSIFVTMDVNLRVRAESIGITAESYENQSVDFSKLMTGMVEYEATYGEIDKLYAEKQLFVEQDYYHNAYVMMKEPTGKTALGKWVKTLQKIVPLAVPKEGVMGIKPKNKEQQFAMDMLLDDNIKVVSLVGMAGCGKTLISSVVGLSKVFNGHYNRLTITRPIVVLGNDIGYLPGDMISKLNPFLAPFYDNLDLIFAGAGKSVTKGQTYEDYMEQGIIKVEPITYIRGRSLHNQFIIVDEAQNLTTHEILTIVSRCGANTKIVFTGDPSQIDTPYLDKNSCGLAVLVERMHNHTLVGHITFAKGERSDVANLAVERFYK